MNSDSASSPASARSWASRVAKARHDLRNPLSDILGFTEILQEEALAAGHHQLLAEFGTIHKAASQLLAQVNFCLSLDVLKENRNVLADLAKTIQTNTDRIIAVGEQLSEKCEALGGNSFGDDLLRITGSARRLGELAGLLQTLAGPEETTTAPLSAQGESQAEEAAAPSSADCRSSAILVVDDNEANRALLSRRLRGHGYNVSLAENGRQALEKLRARKFDLVLLDLMMPEMDGFEVLRRLKADAATLSIPVILLSAVDELDSVVRGIELGADDFLPKPFPTPLLMARVRACLVSKRLADQMRKYTEWLFGKALFAQAVSSPQSLALRRQDRAVLFADVRGFTHWSEQHSPEQVVELLNNYFEAAEKIYLPSAAIKIEYTGDEIMAVFPDALSAIRVALAFQEQIGPLLAKLSLSLGIGLHAGPLIEGLVGGAEVKAYCFVGDTINTGRRVCDQAGGGQILISAATRALAADTVEVGPPLFFQAKGKSEPLQVHPVIRIRS